MAKVVLISCVSKKLSRPAPAYALYTSDLFKKNLAYAKSMRPKAVYVLSAKYGLVPLAKVIAPYDKTLNTMPAAAVHAWAKGVLKALRPKVGKQDEVVFLAGQRYRKHLEPEFGRVSVPMRGLGIGRQLAFLKKQTQHASKK